MTYFFITIFSKVELFQSDDAGTTVAEGMGNEGSTALPAGFIHMDIEFHPKGDVETSEEGIFTFTINTGVELHDTNHEVIFFAMIVYD